ncbi:MAG: AAA family ATPase [Hespellia sp.]|nr:AAA family ATPase [Hespellia sp.]
MFISKLCIKNFMSYENIEINLCENTNLIIGENNIGKTTIFEAILLWGKCYQHNIQKNGRDFYKSNVNIYVNFSELHFLRAVRDEELFFDKGKDISIKLIFEDSSNIFELMFTIEKPKKINNAYFRCKLNNYDEFERFANCILNLGMKLSEAINFYQTAPVSHILKNEPYMNLGQVKKKISLGKSNEVLRNKIISIHQKSNDKSEQLESEISRVLDKEFKFKFPSRAKANTDEYIDLRVEMDDSCNDICVQGSGFLQICEIFSSVDFFDNSINILLVDEPDSHIHAKLQKKLLEELREIDNTQILVISHNDRFLENLDTDHLLFINEAAKVSGIVNRIDIHQINRLKLDLGGISMALCELNNAHNIVFFEGEDDIKYIKNLYRKCKTLINLHLSDYCCFFHIRGRDYIVKKIENIHRVLNTLFTQKKYFTVYDKDFCTQDSADNLKSSLQRINRGQLKAYYHKGYCIESVLFSEKDKLVSFLKMISGLEKEEIESFINEWVDNQVQNIYNISSELYGSMQFKFKSQKTEARPELQAVEFTDYCTEITNDNIQFLMNKGNIKSFILEMENHFSIQLIETEDDVSEEFYSSQLLYKYIENLDNIEILFASYKDLIELLYT